MMKEELLPYLETGGGGGGKRVTGGPTSLSASLLGVLGVGGGGELLTVVEAAAGVGVVGAGRPDRSHSGPSCWCLMFARR